MVAFDEDGARRLGRTYWDVVERTLRGLVGRHRPSARVELRVGSRWPTLLRFGEPEIEVGSALVACRYPIEGGLLARRPQGCISFCQSAGERLELSSTIHGFVPSLAARPGEPHWTGALYDQVQSRIHVAISRRYFARLVAEAPR